VTVAIRPLCLCCLALTLLLPARAGAEEAAQGLVMPGTPCETPYWVKAGAEAGPVLLLCGGMHGDETAGYLAAEQLLTWEIRRGTLVVLPRAHRLAIARHARAYPGNMNAMFPGDAQGDLMHRLAAGIWELIKLTQPDLLITLHESVGFHREEPERFGQTLTYDFERLTPLMQAVLDRVNPDLPSAREKFSVFVKPYKTCPTYCAGKWLNLPATSIETCRQLPLEVRVREQLMVVMGFMDHLGMDYVPAGDLPRLSTAPPPGA
jgi:uncharacterized protein